MMVTKMTYAPFREEEGIYINRDATGGNGVDKGISLNVDLEQMVKEYESIASDEKVSPDVLYRLNVPSQIEYESPRTVMLIQKIQHSLSFLHQALETEEEIERESIMNSFAENIFELTFFPTKSKGFKDAIFLIHTVTEAHMEDIYTRKQLLALQNTLKLIRENLYAGDKTLDKCIELLEIAGFDINAPIAGVELNL